MNTEDLKKLDKRINKIQYPFGESYPVFSRLFLETAKQQNIPVGDVIRLYAAWKYKR